MIDLSSWPEGSRLILRKERPTRARSWPSPTWTGTASLPCSPIPAAASSPGRWPGWNCGTASRPGRTPHPRGLGSQACDDLPGLGRNSAWIETVLAAADLICWAKLICIPGVAIAGPLMSARSAGTPRHNLATLLPLGLQGLRAGSPRRPLQTCQRPTQTCGGQSSRAASSPGTSRLVCPRDQQTPSSQHDQRRRLSRRPGARLCFAWFTSTCPVAAAHPRWWPIPCPAVARVSKTTTTMAASKASR